MAILFQAWRQSVTSRYRGDPWPLVMLGLVILASLVILFPLVSVVWLSFREGSPGEADAVYTLQHYPEVFLDPFTYRVLANTFGFALVTLAVALVFGLPAAWLVERTDLPGKTLLLTVMAIGVLIPGFSSAMGWLFLLHPRIGIVNGYLRDLFGLVEPPFNIATIVGMGWVQGLNLAAVAFIMTAAVFRAMDPALEESAQMSGANMRRTLRHVTLPLAWPGVLAAGIYIFTIGFSAFDVPAIIGWGNRIFVFSTYLVFQLNPEDVLPQYGTVAALSTFMICGAAALSWWYGRMQQHMHRYQVVTGKAYRPNIIRLGRYKYLAWAFIGLYVCLSKLLPLLVLLWASILPYFQLPTAAAFASVSFENYRNLPWDLVKEGLTNTGILMMLTPTVTLFLALAFSWVVLRSRIPGRGGFDFIAFLPHAVPNIVFGVGVLLLVVYVLDYIVPLYGTIWVLLIVFVIARTSYATRMTNSGLIQIHRDLEESGQMSGATTGSVIRAIVAPLLAPTLLYAWLWIALLTFRELTLAIIMTTRDNITLPVVIWNLWFGGGLGKAAAVALMMLLLMIPLVALYWYIGRKQGLFSSG